MTIEKKIRPPAGLQSWYEEFDISEHEIMKGFTFSVECSPSTFNQVFQYKIMTQILPTNQYLARYRVRDSNVCSKCNIMPDTVSHCLWSCQLLVPYVGKIVNFLKETCKVKETIEIKSYLFGFKTNTALNHIFLELKKEFLYSFDKNVGAVTFCEHFIEKIRKKSIKEKACIKSDQMYNKFVEKWKEFTTIYDFHGPDLNIIV